ncbi:UDP-2,3-diacetamido-2,3-dideoxy-D-glucuronate 2-epimerase [Pirellulimonas nuda]|uniref:UDP-2,3-diacetamido-2,3-dideoxy-D-glucuronate 2-epimerase n=1 Tax=Pirellulimonas nuda TaxID=2528009 RepID=A0A518D7D9_9BACT|nr:UDP-N-acetylglucosamine 2-epimerase (non-hydrolyzing) [Pirellulimonas nuda]QDU87397.1 UDP-2,3-diacetamido-2,3-dideoxy-D-glucuronate 2-epimerase [Pirellulimonas nuda]
MLKVMTILGTRPEIIRLSRVMALLDQHVEHVLVHTGQNSDVELNDVFFQDLGVRQPKHFLNIGRESLGQILGDVMLGAERVLRQEKPDAVLILGDTNSAMAAVIARRMKVPVFHMEAGNRCFDFNVPEEINRRIVDHISDFNLVYTEHARRNLLAEGIHPRKIYLTGSPMREVLDANRDAIGASAIVKQLELKPQGYVLVSLHRAENVDIKSNLFKLLGLLNAIAERHDAPVVVSTHPRTRARIDAVETSIDPRVRFLKPFGFHDYIRLQCDSLCTVSDSGTISEESAILGFPAVTTRNAIERPEALDSGHMVLAGLEEGAVLDAVDFVIANREQSRRQPIPAEYQIAGVSQRVLKLILGLTGLSHRWDGINSNDAA